MKTTAWLMKTRPSRTAVKTSPALSDLVYELETVEGLEALAARELQHLLGGGVQILSVGEPAGSVRFRYRGIVRTLNTLQLAEAVFHVLTFDAPRPKALLGDANFRAIIAAIHTIVSQSPARAFRTFHLSAAGSDTTVMRRIKESLAAATHLENDDDQGDLLLRIRRTPRDQRWEVLIRLTPRPLSARSWRVCNFEGALNATVAHAMALLVRPRPTHNYLNLVSGSGTLLIERLGAGPARAVVGVDNSLEALRCARLNIGASPFARHIHMILGRAEQLPLPDGWADALTADLPFGQRSGSHEENRRLYPAALAEAARVARPDARFAVITHEIRLMERVLAEQSHWDVEQILRVTLRGLHPRIYLLRRLQA